MTSQTSVYWPAWGSAALLGVFFAVDPFSSCQAVSPASVAQFPLELNESNYAKWRDHILPAASELDYESLPWLTNFKDGILAADAQQRPLLLWTMNGHPLGCT